MTSLSHRPLLCALALVLMGTAGCSGLLPKPTPLPSFYTLDGVQQDKGSRPIGAEEARAESTLGPLLVVHPPHAAAGFDSPRIIYTRELHRLEYFAHSEWIDTPARMLTPLIVAAVARGGSVRAAVPTPTAAQADIGLDTEIIRLQQDFSVPPSRVRFTLRATLVDSRTRKLIASREFDETVDSGSEDARGGVVAAHRAVELVLARLGTWCAEAARSLKAGQPDSAQDTAQAP